MARSLTLKANRPYPLLFRPQPIFTFEAVDLGGMRGSYMQKAGDT